MAPRTPDAIKTRREGRSRGVVLRTHGGLGNQIFQILFGRLEARRLRVPLFEIHDASYKHRFQRSAEIPVAAHLDSVVLRTISSIRLPKILARLRADGAQAVRFGGVLFADGYFQCSRHFEKFDRKVLASEILHIATSLGISPDCAKISGTLLHLRLGDAFKNEQEEAAVAIKVLSVAPMDVHVITNRPSIIFRDSIRKLLNSKRAIFIDTSRETPESILRILSSYVTVLGTESTLAFWAHVMSGTNVEIATPRLADLAHRFRDSVCA